ncbi:MAG: hypothetical protein V4726_07205 [Verrucomicrobiota bacterium]
MNFADIINPNIPVPGELVKWGYRRMSEADYRAFPAINNSLLKCPTLAEMRMLLTAPQKQTDALALGTLADMAILTPEEPWTERFAVADIPINPKTGKAYGADSQKAVEAFEAAVAASPGKFVASADAIREMTAELAGIVKAFNDSALCRKTLEGALTQVSGIMFHPVWKCWVKWKPDVLPLKPDEKYGWSIADLKTSARHVLQFEKDCFEFGYFDQAGWYSHCHETLLATRGQTLRVANFDFLLVGKVAAGRQPRPPMARKIRVPLDPLINQHMESHRRRVFPEDGFGRVEMFLSALREHIAADPDPKDPDALSRIWGAFENESEPCILARLPRAA